MRTTASKNMPPTGRPPGSGALERVFRFLERVGQPGFFGKVVVSFQNGKVCEVRLEQTHKPDEI